MPPLVDLLRHGNEDGKAEAAAALVNLERQGSLEALLCGAGAALVMSSATPELTDALFDELRSEQIPAVFGALRLLFFSC